MTLQKRVLVLLLALSACATGSGQLPTPSPAEIPDLESYLDGNPEDVDAGLRLAAAYRAVERLPDARALVDRQLELVPDEPGLVAMAGLLAEDAGDYAVARERYEAFLALNRSGPLRDDVRGRLAVVRQEELRADVRRALEREAELAQTAPDPAAISIFPFGYEGDDPTWEPLGTALAELLITDLSITGRLRVLERLHVQALLQEVALAEAGFVSPETAARGGRLLGSGRVVQGRFRVGDGDMLDIDAAVVEVGPAGSERVEPVTATDRVERLFELEKQLALDLHAEMGVQLTPAEEARINERHTESVQALLAFGRGLQAADGGDFVQAESYFAEATSLDPSFALAQSQQQLAAQATLAQGAQGRQQLSAQASRVARQRAAVQALRNAPASVRQRMLQQLGARKRAVLAELLGQDRVGTTILLELVFRRPGGSP